MRANYYPRPGKHDSWYLVPRGKHAKSRRRFTFTTAILLLAPILCLGGVAAPAEASESSLGNAALNWAEAHATGCWYAWGGTNCAQGYDCSGLVSSAILAADHVWIGRDTYDMLGTHGEGHLVEIPLQDARRGDLLFWGSGHVEFATVWYHGSYGAQEPGTRVGWHSYDGWWFPTSAWRLYLPLCHLHANPAVNAGSIKVIHVSLAVDAEGIMLAR